MDSVTRYGFINAKLRARIGAINDSSFIERMIKAPTLFESVSVLKGTRYDRAAEVYEKTGDLEQVELTLFQSEISTYNEIISYLDPEINRFLSVLLQKLEIENIKSAIRLWYSAAIRRHPVSYRAGYLFKEKIVYDIDYMTIINKERFEDVKKAFEMSPYKELFNSWSTELFAQKGLFDLEMQLDRLWYDILYVEIQKLTKKDNRVALDIYNTDSDLKNILMIIRYGLFHNLSSSVLEKYIIPQGKLSPKILSALKNGPDAVYSVLPLVERYYPQVAIMMKEIIAKKEDANLIYLAEETLKIENYLARNRKSAFLKVLSSDPFSVGILLSYFFLFEHEMSLIKAVLSAKYYKCDEAKIREELL